MMPVRLRFRCPGESEGRRTDKSQISKFPHNHSRCPSFVVDEGTEWTANRAFCRHERAGKEVLMWQEWMLHKDAEQHRVLLYYIVRSSFLAQLETSARREFHVKAYVHRSCA